MPGLAPPQGRDVDTQTPALYQLRGYRLWNPEKLVSDLRSLRWIYIVALNLPTDELVFAGVPDADFVLRDAYSRLAVYPLDTTFTMWGPRETSGKLAVGTNSHRDRRRCSSRYRNYHQLPRFALERAPLC
jgi:hypothetical protein